MKTRRLRTVCGPALASRRCSAKGAVRMVLAFLYGFWEFQPHAVNAVSQRNDKLPGLPPLKEEEPPWRLYEYRTQRFILDCIAQSPQHFEPAQGNGVPPNTQIAVKLHTEITLPGSQVITYLTGKSKLKSVRMTFAVIVVDIAFPKGSASSWILPGEGVRAKPDNVVPHGFLPWPLPDGSCFEKQDPLSFSTWSSARGFPCKEGAGIVVPQLPMADGIKSCFVLLQPINPRPHMQDARLRFEQRYAEIVAACFPSHRTFDLPVDPVELARCVTSQAAVVGAAVIPRALKLDHSILLRRPDYEADVGVASPNGGITEGTFNVLTSQPGTTDFSQGEMMLTLVCQPSQPPP